MRKRIASMTDEERKRKRKRERRRSMTDEERERERERIASMTDEQRERRRERKRERQRKWRTSMTEEQRERHREYIRQWRTSMTEEQRERKREYDRQWRAAMTDDLRGRKRVAEYGITHEQWSAMFEAQGRCCAICRSDNPRSKRDWNTDHCHETGRVRGILCAACNLGLGAFRDEIVTMEHAIQYLRTHRACGHLTCETAPAGKCLLESAG